MKAFKIMSDVSFLWKQFLKVYLLPRFLWKKNGTLNDDNLFKTSVEIEISQE